MAKDDDNKVGAAVGLAAAGIGLGLAIAQLIKLSKDKKRNSEVKIIESDINKNIGSSATKTHKKYVSNDFARTCSADKQLDEMIGLASVKQQVKIMKASLSKQKALGNKVNMNMCFYGNPGTGKTEVARLIGRILYDSGLLPSPKFVETDRSGLVAEYVGQTTVKTHEIFRSAIGGVLFIDEAYSLGSSGRDDFGKEAIAALLKDMEDYRGKICVILAGYKNEMNSLFELNPGFKSRITKYIDFPDYSFDELEQIIVLIAKKEKYHILPDALKLMTKIVYRKSGSTDFANARDARNVFESIRDLQSLRTEGTLNATIIIKDVYEYMNQYNINL